MAISGVSMNSFNVKNNIVFPAVSSSKITRESNVARNTSYSAIPLAVYQANFAPSFGKYKKVKDVSVIDKKSQQPVRAALLRDVDGSSVSYKLVSGRTELGYMHMNCNSIFKEDKYLCPEPDNNIPEITHIRSLEGDKYYGIGTNFINAAVEESLKRGKRGCVWCYAEQGYAAALSSYRKYENPIPFYYKMGFKSLDPQIDALIQRGIQTNNLGLLPEATTLILTSEDSDKFRKNYSSSFSFARKIA